MTTPSEMDRQAAHVKALIEWRARSDEERTAYFLAKGTKRKPRTGRVRAGFLCPCLVMGGAEAWQLTVSRYTDTEQIEWRGCCVVGEANRIDPAMLEATSRLMPVSVGHQSAVALANEVDVLIPWAIDGLVNLLACLPEPPKILSAIHAPIESRWGQTVYAQAGGIDRWVAVSELALAALPPSSRTVPSSTIWNCVDEARLQVRRDRATMRKLWGVPEGAPIAGFLGRLAHEKDPTAMIRLAGSLPEEWFVVVVGSGDERLDLIQPPNVILTGNDPAAGDVLNAFDVLVVPSHYESFGLTIAEGLAAGVPIVSTEVGIAKIVPGITHTIPINADGPTIAQAVLKARFNRPPGDVAGILTKLKPERFGKEWTDLICSMVPTEPEVRRKVSDCPDRGGVLPLSLQPDCDCRGAELSECRAGKGRIPGRVSVAECVDCCRKR